MHSDSSSTMPTSQPASSDARPSLPMISQQRSQLESILLVLDAPAPAEQLARALDTDTGTITALLREIGDEFDQRGSGIELRKSEEGYRLYTRTANGAAVEKFILDGTQTKLSRAALETLAIIAYRQPVTRAQVAAVRGVNVDGVMRTLAIRGMIREVAHPDTTENETTQTEATQTEATEGAEEDAPSSPSSRARLYVTTELFLEQLGIDSLEALPELAPLLPELDSIDDQF